MKSVSVYHYDAFSLEANKGNPAAIVDSAPVGSVRVAAPPVVPTTSPFVFELFQNFACD